MKTTGEDGLSNEILKTLSEYETRRLHGIINMVYKNKNMPIGSELAASSQDRKMYKWICEKSFREDLERNLYVREHKI